MAILKRVEGKLTIEQSRDRELVRAMLSAAGMIIDGVGWPSACYLVAWFGAEPAGVVGVEARVAAALIRSLFVVEPMRRRGIGASLIGAARKAAHTRGARTLYCLGAGAGAYLDRFGFERAPADMLVQALGGAPLVEYYLSHPEELSRKVAWRLDISRDGVIIR